MDTNEKIIYDIRHTCVNCGKAKGKHLSSTGNCPRKSRIRTQWVSYETDKFFEPNPKWKPPKNDFKI